MQNVESFVNVKFFLLSVPLRLIPERVLKMFWTTKKRAAEQLSFCSS